jgi:DHA2 family methylenomycin A resistance protein-like MFS transporter
VNVPVGLAAGRLLARHADETTRRRRPLDLPGQLIAMVSLAALTGGFISAGAHGWTAGVTLGLGIFGVLGSAAFVLVERTARLPLIDPDVFRDKAFTTVVAIGFVFNFCLYGSIFCLAVGLGRLRGLDALDTGLSLLPMTVVAAAMALFAGRLVPRLGEWPVVVAGLASGAVGATLVALNGNHAHLAVLLLSTVPIGATALAMPAMTGLAMASGPRLRLGLSAGLFNASRQAGGALGVAVLGTILTSGPGASVSLRRPFLLTAGAYGLAVALATAGTRGLRETHAAS